MANNMATDALEMSDEDFLKQPVSAFESQEEEQEEIEPEEEEESPGEDEQDEEETTDAPEEEEEILDPVKGEAKTPESSKEIEGVKETEPEVKGKADTSTLSDTDYINIGKQIMSEFKANGKPIKLKSVDDAIQLMQMGANYHKKMTGLKPSLKILKLLENNDLLDQSKLNYLIDLSQKKPEAITQLLKDSKMDPMEIDLEGENKYVPNHRTVNDTEILLDEVLDSISESPSYNKTLTVLGDEWDEASRSTIAKEPELIRTINMHMDNGIYDQVVSAVNYERSLGRLKGVSDFEAYQRVGSYMNENKLFQSSTVNQTAKANQNINNTHATPKGETAEQAQQRLNRKKAASPSRQSTSQVKDDNKYNPLEMSDEEFIKLNKLNL